MRRGREGGERRRGERRRGEEGEEEGQEATECSRSAGGREDGWMGR